MRTIDRLDIYMKSKGLSDNRVCKCAGLSQGLLIKSRKQGKDLQRKQVEKILSFYTDLSEVWLQTGHGEMLINPDEYTEIIKMKSVEPIIETKSDDSLYQMIIKEMLTLAAENALLKEKVDSYEKQLGI